MELARQLCPALIQLEHQNKWCGGSVEQGPRGRAHRTVREHYRRGRPGQLRQYEGSGQAGFGCTLDSH